MYKVDGSDMGQETTLAQLEGYEGALPIRVGNAASDQLQLDTQGSFVNLVYEYSRSSTIDERTWDAVRRVVEQVVLLWPLPDNGLWEMRGPRQHFTFSKVMCWVALDRGAKVARLLGHVELADEWDQVARTVREQVLTNALCTAGYLGQYYGSDAPDAALLLMASLGFIEASHPVFRATVLKIAESLAEGPYVWRYRARTTPDGLAGEPEASFTICSFWLVQALCEIGEHDRARDNATALLASAGPLGLYAEQIDAVTGAHLGNFPQAFSHLALIDALETLTRLV
jgi:GH15 family glucan-1,4-alpha-glucosidase